MTQSQVLTELKRLDVLESAAIVGRWVWVQFKAHPGDHIRCQLREIGFRWNEKRKAWQHDCGNPRRFSKGNPVEKYGFIKASEVLN